MTAMHVHIHANCQAVPLAGMLNEVYPGWKVTYYEVHAQHIIDELDNYYHRVRSADIVLTQPIHGSYRGRDDLTVDWVKRNARSNAIVVVIPPVHFAAHQPTWNADPFPGFDLLAAHLVAFGLSPDDAIERLLSPDLLTDAEIEREIAIAEARRREVEGAIDIPYASFLDQHGFSRLLCDLSNHPLRETMVFVANSVLARLGYKARVASTAATIKTPFTSHRCRP